MFCCQDMTKSERAAVERKLILGFTGLTMLGFLMEIIAVSTDSWLLFKIEGGLYQNKTHTFLHRVYSGLWRICRVTTKEPLDYKNSTEGNVSYNNLTSAFIHEVPIYKFLARRISLDENARQTFLMLPSLFTF